MRGTRPDGGVFCLRSPKNDTTITMKGRHVNHETLLLLIPFSFSIRTSLETFTSCVFFFSRPASFFVSFISFSFLSSPPVLLPTYTHNPSSLHVRFQFPFVSHCLRISILASLPSPILLVLLMCDHMMTIFFSLRSAIFPFSHLRFPKQFPLLLALLLCLFLNRFHKCMCAVCMLSCIVSKKGVCITLLNSSQLTTTTYFAPPLRLPILLSLHYSSLSHFPRPGLGRNMGGAILVVELLLSTSIDAPAAERAVTLKASSESAHVPPSGFSASISRVWSRSRVPAMSKRETWVVMVFSRYRRMGRAPYCVLQGVEGWVKWRGIR